MRVTTAFNRILDLPGATVSSVEFTEAGVVVGVRRRAQRHSCPCGATTRARYDQSRRKWRHLDLAATPLWLEADIARIDCRGCGRVRTEEVPWARPGARHSRDFEDVVAFLAQRTDKTSIWGLLRCSWEAVDRIVTNVVADHIDDTRLDGLGIFREPSRLPPPTAVHRPSTDGSSTPVRSQAGKQTRTQSKDGWRTFDPS